MAATDIWHYIITGTAAHAQTWETTGSVICDFIDAFESANRESFQQLTQGKAVYGHPGVGCIGPYKVNKVILAKAEN